MKKIIGLFAMLTFGISCASLQPKPDPTKCQSCDLYVNPETKQLCKQAFCSIVTPSPTIAPTSVAPIVTATKIPVPMPTQIPTGWVTTAIFVNGFSGCNPCAAGDQYCHCPNHVACSGIQQCHGDRTYWFTMVGFDVIPQGTGCTTDACRARDSTGTPCAGAPACDADHMGCARVNYSCNGSPADEKGGSSLSCTGTLSCIPDADNYGFTGFGTIGQTYMICAHPKTNPYLTDNGRTIPVQGTGEHCISGTY